MTDLVGAWDCSYCSQTKIAGYIYDCPGCGHPRSRDVRFYLPADAPVATAEQMALMGGHDPNWYCLGCDSGNKELNTACWNCGTPRGQAPAHKTTVYTDDADIPRNSAQANTRTASQDWLPLSVGLYKHGSPNLGTTSPDSILHVKNPGDKFSIDPAAGMVGGWNTAPAYSGFDGVPASKRTDRWNGLAEEKDIQEHVIDFVREHDVAVKYTSFGAAITLALLAIWLLFFNYHDTPATVVGFNWSRNVAVEEYQLLSQEGWSQPPDATPVKHETRQSGTRKVIDGYRTITESDTCYRTVHHSQTCTRDNGNGSYSSYDCGSTSSEPYSCTKTRQEEISHQEPVYDTWYFYRVWRWVNIENHPTSGNDKEPFYSKDGTQDDSLHRRIPNAGTYTVSFSCDELGPFTRNYDQATWENIQLNRVFLVKTNAVHAILELTSIDQ